MTTLSDIPSTAHFDFACPFCQVHHGTLTRLSTAMATHLTVDVESGRFEFRGIQCSACSKKICATATLNKPLPNP